MAQESEWNELAYDNIATTFSLSTDNVATSDELSAPPVYENGEDTLYAKNHRAKKITTISLITLSATAASGTSYTTFPIMAKVARISPSDRAGVAVNPYTCLAAR